MANAIEESPAFELGDRIYIEGGRLEGTRGRIYYMDADLIRILPEGAPDRVVDIPIVDGDFSEDLGIENFYLLSKRANPAFVAQIDAHVGELADTFGPDGLGLQYKIKEVNEQEDFLVLEDETGGELRVDCDFTGIPQDLPFVVLRPRQRAERGNPNAISEAEPEPEAEEDDFFKDIDIVPEEEEEFQGLVERAVIDRIYPDRVQRDEMFRSILEALPLLEQKNPKTQKDIRQFVEQCMLLRNTVVEYNTAGEPVGRITTSFQTIAELLKNGDIPLARPVINANRTLYLDMTEDENPIEAPGVAVNIEYLRMVVDDSNKYLDTELGGTAGMLATPDALPHWIPDLGDILQSLHEHLDIRWGSRRDHSLRGRQGVSPRPRARWSQSSGRWHSLSRCRATYCKGDCYS
jgi:hypothetical protein